VGRRFRLLAWGQWRLRFVAPMKQAVIPGVILGAGPVSF